jgi:uncharacterized protein YkwD
MAGVVTTVVTGLVLAVPVVSGGSTGTSPVALDSSSTASRTSDGGVSDRPTGAPSPAVPVGSGSPSVSAAAPGTTGAAPSDASPTSASSSPSAVAPASVAPSSSSEQSSAPALPASPEPDAPVPVAPVPASGAPKDELLTLLDEVRTGCDPLLPDDSLAAVAQAHSAAMRDQDFFGLQDLAGHSPLDDGARAAWVAHGTAAPADVLDAWLADPDVRATVTDCGLTSVGVGRARGDGGPWWTLLLA